MVREGTEQAVHGLDRVAGVGEGYAADHVLPPREGVVPHPGRQRPALNEGWNLQPQEVKHGRHDVHR